MNTETTPAPKEVPQPASGDVEIDRDDDGELLIDWSPRKGRMLALSLRKDGRLSYAFAWDDEKAHGTTQMPSRAASGAPQEAPGDAPSGWQPIETAPKDGFFLVYEDGAVRTLMRTDGEWKSPAIAALGNDLWPQDHLVGLDAERVLPKGYRLKVLECCIEPTHWMPLPKPPAAMKGPQ